MNITEKILNMSVWKAAAIALVSILLVLFLIEGAFINIVFSTINSRITHFEKISSEDKNDFDKHIKAFDQRNQYDIAEAGITSDYISLSVAPTPQEEGCYLAKTIKAYEAMLKFPYVKKQDDVRSSVNQKLEETRVEYKSIVTTNKFDVKKCEVKS